MELVQSSVQSGALSEKKNSQIYDCDVTWLHKSAILNFEAAISDPSDGQLLMQSAKITILFLKEQCFVKASASIMFRQSLLEFNAFLVF